MAMKIWCTAGATEFSDVKCGEYISLSEEVYMKIEYKTPEELHAHTGWTASPSWQGAWDGCIFCPDHEVLAEDYIASAYP